MFPAKDPRETIVVTFDFSAVAATVSNPVVTLSLSSGTDINPPAMLLGTAVVSDGNKVLQRVTGGNAGADYRLSCLITSGNQDLLISEILRIRTA